MECGGQVCEVCAGSSCSCSTQSASRESGSSSNVSRGWQAKVCYKCKEAPAQVAANQTEVLCASCLNASLFSKFKTAINTHDLILPFHKVLLAFSGGPSSRVALEYLLEIREKAQREAMHCNDGSVKVFGFGVAHVNESSILPLAPSNSEILGKELSSIVMGGDKKPDEFLNIPLENMYSDAEFDVSGTNGGDLNSRRERLQMLLKNVADPTGKEDLLEHLRMQTLQQVAKEYGYTRLVLGLSTSRIAVKVISETAKGCGFSLPAGMQYYDARWNVPVILPLRDCIAKELALLCHLRKLNWVFIPTLSTLSLPQRTINSLSASFVSGLQEDNPSRERTIMRTAAKLQPFSFNHVGSFETCSVHKQSTRLSILHGTHKMEETIVESLCLVCCAPLNPQESSSSLSPFQILEPKTKLKENIVSNRDSSITSAASFMDKCCLSCQYQLFGGNPLDDTHNLLPQSMKASEVVNPTIKEMWMRSQISDFLLSESDSDE